LRALRLAGNVALVCAHRSAIFCNRRRSATQSGAQSEHFFPKCAVNNKTIESTGDHKRPPRSLHHIMLQRQYICDRGTAATAKFY